MERGGTGVRVQKCMVSELLEAALVGACVRAVVRESVLRASCSLRIHRKVTALE